MELQKCVTLFRDPPPARLVGDLHQRQKVLERACQKERKLKKWQYDKYRLPTNVWTSVRTHGIKKALAGKAE